MSLEPSWETEGQIATENIISFSYSCNENLLFTTALDRQVKIWDARDGKYIESLRQNNDEIGAKPIAYKKFGTKRIYDTDKVTRVDTNIK